MPRLASVNADQTLTGGNVTSVGLGSGGSPIAKDAIAMATQTLVKLPQAFV